jgi:hypothetical protein
MTTFNVFAFFWHEILAGKRTHSSVNCLLCAISGQKLMLECVRLAAKISCQKYVNTLKVVMNTFGCHATIA